jgi:hypothetical protein
VSTGKGKFVTKWRWRGMEKQETGEALHGNLDAVHSRSKGGAGGKSGGEVAGIAEGIWGQEMDRGEVA